MQQYLRNSEELNDAANMLFKKISSGKIKIKIYKKYKLNDIKQAHIDLENRKITGPAVIIP
jgi:NADPH2:quinone reductase